jgi:hypothetical protein
MNVFSALIKCASVGFFAGFLTSSGPQLGNDVLSLAGLMAFIGLTLVLFELTSLGSLATVPKAVYAPSVRAAVRK